MTKDRLNFLDFIRFLAAFAVIFQHTCESLFPQFRDFCSNYFQFGVFGVTLFFLCSGFIIPVSISKGGLINFWIGRVFRLMPLYYLSITISLLLIHFKIVEGELPSLNTILWNMTMLMKFVGKPSILGLYWTLSLEMLFYITISILHYFNILSFRVIIYLIISSVAILAAVSIPLGWIDSFKGWGTLMNISTMFLGSVFYEKFVDKISFTKLNFVFIVSILTIFITVYFNLYNVKQPLNSLGTFNFTSVFFAQFLAYILFYVFFFFKQLVFSKALVYLGTISYSLYLVQETVYSIVPVIEENKFLTLILWIILIIVISTFTYNTIELTFIKIGGNLKKKVAKILD